jgi:hypothetical protein
MIRQLGANGDAVNGTRERVPLQLAGGGIAVSLVSESASGGSRRGDFALYLSGTVVPIAAQYR